MKFYNFIFQASKVMEFKVWLLKNHRKSWKISRLLMSTKQCRSIHIKRTWLTIKLLELAIITLILVTLTFDSGMTLLREIRS